MENTNSLNHITDQSFLQIGVLIGSLFLVSVFILSMINTLRGKKLNYINKQDSLIQTLLMVTSYGGVLFADVFLGMKGIFTYVLIYSFVGLIFIEFLGNFLWFRIMGTRLYTYYRNDLLKFTSWNMLPFWGGAGLYFYSVWRFLGLGSIDLDWFEFAKSVLAFGIFNVAVILVVYGLASYLRGKLKVKAGFRWMKYLVFVGFLWGGLLLALIEHKLLIILPYFIFTSISAIVMEGFLGYCIKSLYGENFWIYRRMPLFKGTTSWLILPIWAIASGLALVVFKMLGL